MRFRVLQADKRDRTPKECVPPIREALLRTTGGQYLLALERRKGRGRRSRSFYVLDG